MLLLFGDILAMPYWNGEIRSIVKHTVVLQKRAIRTVYKV